MAGGITLMRQSEDDLVSHLIEQLAFIRISSVSYDNGFFGESKRLANTITTLVHDTAQSTSLLSQIGKKDILFCDTGARSDAPFEQMNAIMEKYRKEQEAKGKLVQGVSNNQRLVIMATFGKSCGASGLWKPLLEEGLEDSAMLAFNDWWVQPVISDVQGAGLSRKELVLSVRNKDGGAHIDPVLDLKYAQVTRTNAERVRLYQGDEFIQESGPEHGTVRQIAFEVEYSIRSQLGAVLS